MNHLIRSEWIKFRSVRSTVVTLLLAGAIVVLVAVLVARTADDDTTTDCVPMTTEQMATSTTTSPEALAPGEDGTFFDAEFCGEGYLAVTEPITTNLSGLTGGVSFAALLFGVLGVQVIGQEYRFNTIRPTFTAAPNRIRVLLAKLVVVTTACAAVSAVMTVFCYLVGTTMLDRFEVDATDQRLFWAIPLFAALWTGAGMAVGAIVRQPIAAILILLGESLVLESLLAGIFEWTQPWLPFANGFQMTLRTDGDNGGLRGVLEGGVYFAIVCAMLWIIGAVLANRRDA
jgi:ABC-2 type transport system permease protein